MSKQQIEYMPVRPHWAKDSPRRDPVTVTMERPEAKEEAPAFMPIRPHWATHQPAPTPPQVARRTALRDEAHELRTIVDRERAAGREFSPAFINASGRLAEVEAALRELDEAGPGLRSTSRSSKAPADDCSGGGTGCHCAECSTPAENDAEEYMPVRPHWEERRPATIATNEGAGVEWPTKWSERHALVVAAVAELKTAGAA